MDARGVEKKLGVRPDQVADQLALAGDKVDNIPGVPGIGMATAARILRKLGTLDAVFAEPERVAGLHLRGAKRLAALIQDHEETVRMARDLTAIQCHIEDIPAELNLNPTVPDRMATNRLLDQFGFDNQRRVRWNALLDRLEAGEA